MSESPGQAEQRVPEAARATSGVSRSVRANQLRMQLDVLTCECGSLYRPDASDVE